MRSKISMGMALMILLLFVCAGVAMAQQTSGQALTALDKTAAMEKYFYGNEQSGALTERITKLEKDVYGYESKDALLNKVDRLYNYMANNTPAESSFIMKLNAVEWALTHAVTAEPAKTRLDNLERVLVGNTSVSDFDSRLTKLAKLAYANGQVQPQAAPIMKDSLVKIKMISPLDTRTSKAGDEVVFQAAEDFLSGDTLIIAKGALGHGKVIKVERSKNFGRDAKLVVAFDAMTALDGSHVDTLLGDKAKEQTRSMAKAAGASVAGMFVLGPIGVVGGAFVHGEEVTMPAGTELYIQTKTEVEVYGIQVNK